MERKKMDKIICTRCNSEAVSVWTHNGKCRIRCGYCDADTGEQNSEAKALQIWNTFRRPAVGADTQAVRVMSKNELLDSALYDGEDIRPVWFENRGLFCVPALVQNGLAERELGCVRVEWHNSFGSKSFDVSNYGSWWRCWTDKPSLERLETEEWQSE